MTEEIDEVKILENLYEDLAEGTDSNWQLEYFESQYPRYRPTIEIVRQYCGDGRLIDLGAVPGHLSYLLQRAGWDVTALDLDPMRLAPTIRSSGIDVIQFDIERAPLPIADNTFDTVLLCEVFEHLRINPVDVLQEIQRILSADGRLLITTPNLYFLARVAQFLGFKNGVMWGSPYDAYNKIETKGHVGHVRIYTLAEICQCLNACGFDIVHTEFRMMEWDEWESKNVDGLWDRPKSWAARVVTRFIPRLRKTIVVVAKPKPDKMSVE